MKVLLPPFASPENWRPSPADVFTLTAADLFVTVGHSGLPFERRFELLAADSSVPVVRLSELSGDRMAVSEDPHLWLDIGGMAVAAGGLAEKLTMLDPAGRTDFEANLANLRAELSELERQVIDRLSGLEQGVIVVQHPAWDRLLEPFGIVELAIEPEGKSPSGSDLVEIIETARTRNVDTVFAQTGLSDRSPRLVARELGARLFPTDPLARDWMAEIDRFTGEIATILE